MSEAAASRRGPAESPRRRRSGVGCWGDQPGGGGDQPGAGGEAPFSGEGAKSALNSREVNSSHSNERAKCGALLCRAASETASATRSCTQQPSSPHSNHRRHHTVDTVAILAPANSNGTESNTNTSLAFTW